MYFVDEEFVEFECRPGGEQRTHLLVLGRGQDQRAASEEDSTSHDHSG
jgi:hypothetical protein